MWARIVNILLGCWLVAAPAVLDYGDPAATNDQIVGPLAAAFATIAISETTRPVRRVNIALGIWLVAAPWLLGYDEGRLILHSMAAGIVMAACAAVRGRVEQRFGGGWSALWRSGENE